ncbi:hypothetical protein F4553_007096 [Allocatelliglobosispora scoriae]|uniref:Uncharacterized protein n=1 Tax=Allocatelliglobosispora scoriae TaxID=643052 RepID=A0A841C3M6_9ACTN|nr:hypothetical protein [Allocatelliglobosispora scoriae]MBB5873662.1 hypothetical protein [Allocatelliglobosispora scoriae]
MTDLGERMLGAIVPKAKASAACPWPNCNGWTIQWTGTSCEAGGKCFYYDCRNGNILRAGGCGRRYS